jgi:hypothetical protein
MCDSLGKAAHHCIFDLKVENFISKLMLGWLECKKVQYFMKVECKKKTN